MTTTWSELRRRCAVAALALAGGLPALTSAAAAAGPAASLSRVPASRPPNVLLLVVDTLRADHLEPYGWPVPTSPNVTRLLAARGIVVERAHAMAPWTIPSMIGLFAGRAPGELLHGPPAAYRMPPDLPLLSTELRARGYDTAAFVGNPALAGLPGIARGFDSFWPAIGTTQWTRGAALSALARHWLATRDARRPFFLYVHYVEPHDPYDSPDRLEGRSPFYPRYDGPVDGGWPHGLMLGRLRLADLGGGLRHLEALYDDEVIAVDQAIGELLASVDDDTLRHTIVVLTADHGEELYDHRGWKHGRTLYEEMLRVPLVVRWDERLPAGVRSDAPAQLGDLAPTLLAATGASPPRAWTGVDLVPALRGEPVTASRVFFAQHLGEGARRLTALVGRWKLLLYDRRARAVAGDAYAADLAREESARLPRLALFDLASDPGETRDLAAAHGDLVARLGGVAQERLGRELPGLRVLLSGVEPGRTVDVDLVLGGRGVAWESLFLGDGDLVRASGERLHLRLRGEALAKGVLLPPGTRVLALRTTPPIGVRLANGRRYAGGAMARAAVRAAWPGTDGRPELLLWEPPGVAATGAPIDDEQLRRLRALGYAGGAA